MLIYIVWERYTQNWILDGKGARFMNIPDPELIDSDLEDYVMNMSKAAGIDPEYFVITSIQQMNLKK